MKGKYFLSERDSQSTYNTNGREFIFDALHKTAGSIKMPIQIDLELFLGRLNRGLGLGRTVWNRYYVRHSEAAQCSPVERKCKYHFSAYPLHTFWKLNQVPVVLK